MRSLFTLCVVFTTVTFTLAQKPGRSNVSSVWVSDLGNGQYRNPILHADYSDPDVCRVGDDYFMVSSSFNATPGLPVLHSTDLVNWNLIGYALQKQIPEDHFSKPPHGNGVWAPSIRFHKGEFYIYYPDPDFGIYLIKSRNAAGPWTEPVLVEGGKGLIDPCPLWDDDGNNYLVHAFAGSRAGIKSVLVIKKLNSDGTRVLDHGRIVYDGHNTDPTVEGPKFYKRNGFYYIFAPAGGVATGWQIVLRSRHVYGPYERRIVMDQGNTAINGPHQGAWVDTTTGEHWFIHFQDKEAYGRIVHLQPMQWKNDWPVIGVDNDGDGKGEPVSIWKKPSVKKTALINTPPDSDEFDGHSLGLQWQWHANPSANWAFLTNDGTLRLYSQRFPDGAKNLWDIPNLLLQKLPANEFNATTLLSFRPNKKIDGEQVGFIMMGVNYAGLFVRNTTDGLLLVYKRCSDAPTGSPEEEIVITKIDRPMVYLRMKVESDATVTFSYSLDGNKFTHAGERFTATPGKWIGAKIGFVCSRNVVTNDAGYADIDWIRFTKDDQVK
jgi:beta-xylosidase